HYSDDAHSIAAVKKIHDVARILVVVASHDGNAVEGGLKNIVSTARHQAATDERDGGQRIERSQLPDTVDQKHSASERFAAPQGTPQHSKAEFLDERRNFRKPLRMPGCKDHHGLRMIGQDVAKRRKQRAFFVLERAATHQNRAGSRADEALTKASNDPRRWRRSHIKFQVAGDPNFRFRRTNFYETLP